MKLFAIVVWHKVKVLCVVRAQDETQARKLVNGRVLHCEELFTSGDAGTIFFTEVPQ
jgi:hypothetical protein